jgi:hypothetical protein
MRRLEELVLSINVFNTIIFRLNIFFSKHWEGISSLLEVIILILFLS